MAVTSADQPLKLTLAWTDPPGVPAASGALINDLDLVLVAPDGVVYRGNRWSGDDVNVPGDKSSLPNAVGKDDVNNVEGILLPTPATGRYEVSIVGADVPGQSGQFTQGGALVITGAVAEIPPFAPPPVPDGVTGAPMRASRVEASTAAIELLWDADSCTSEAYHVLYGPLADVGLFTIDGAECDPGTSGSYFWSGVPGGDLWFLIAGNDGSATEGSWGRPSGGGARGGANASEQCGLTVRDEATACLGE